MGKLTEPLFLIDPRKVGLEVIAESPCAGWHVKFKDRCSIGAFSYIGLESTVEFTRIGRYCSIAPNVTLGPAEHNLNNFSTHPFADGNSGPLYRSAEFLAIQTLIPRPHAGRGLVNIGHDVWIGTNVVVRKGVNIGNGAVVAAGSVVVRDVSPYEIVGGVPARTIRYRFEPSVVERLLKSEWWNFDLSGLGSAPIDYGDANGVLNRIEDAHSSATLKRLVPQQHIFRRLSRTEQL